MKNQFCVLSCVLLCVMGVSAQKKTEKVVIEAVKLFYADFNDGAFARADEYTTSDWNHINPFGGRTVGRDAVLSEVRAVHTSFLKGVTDTPESFDVKFSSPNVALVIVPSRMSTFTTPDGVKHENERNIRTFVVVKRENRWRIMHDHNTIIAGLL
ncbi:MAG: SgcJ/EcaC family oxidoreductase [bacterium]|nr:SgcJ/EcaC family oxidoreductase [bacterium]